MVVAGVGVRVRARRLWVSTGVKEGGVQVWAGSDWPCVRLIYPCQLDPGQTMLGKMATKICVMLKIVKLKQIERVWKYCSSRNRCFGHMVQTEGKLVTSCSNRNKLSDIFFQTERKLADMFFNKKNRRFQHVAQLLAAAITGKRDLFLLQKVEEVKQKFYWRCSTRGTRWCRRWGRRRSRKSTRRGNRSKIKI